MDTRILKVLQQSDTIQMQKQDGTSIHKSVIILQEIGRKYEDSYVCTLLGNNALCRFYPGDIVFAALRFAHREYNGNMYQDITVQDIVKVGA